MNQILDDIDYLHLEISNALRKDLSYDQSNDLWMNTRRMAMRVIFHLLRLKTEIWSKNDMNFDVGYGCLKYIAEKNGIEATYHEDLGDMLESTIIPAIDAQIEKCREAMGYSTDDIDALIQVTG